MKANDQNPNNLADTRPMREFQGRAVVSMDSGKKIGVVEDILIDPGHMRIESILTSAGGVLRSNIQAIKAEDIAVWGEDVILARHNDVIRGKSDLPGIENYISAFEDIPGRDVISLEGERLGKVEDIQITASGQMAGFSMNHARGGGGLSDLFKNDRKEHYLLPIATLHSFGKDVLIIDKNRAGDILTFLHTEKTETASQMGEGSFIPATGSARAYEAHDEHAAHEEHDELTARDPRQPHDPNDPQETHLR